MKGSGSKPATVATRLVAIVLFCALFPGQVLAQSSEMNAVRDSLERIRQDLSDLQRHVYRGTTPSAPAAPSSISPARQGVEDEGRRAADTLIQVTALENELRGLTGAIEEIKHQVDTAQLRLDKLVEDVDFRLAAIERSLADVTDIAAQQLSTIQPEAGTPAAGTPGGDTSLRVPEPSSEHGVLGTIPVDKLPQAEGEVQQAAVQPQEPKALLPDGTPKERYDFALGLLREGLLRSQELVRAEQAFKEFLVAHTDHSLADNARYWLGESFYVRENYNEAAAAFIEGYQASPGGIKAPDNLLKLGMSLSRLSRGEEACATFQELNEKFPELSGSIRERIKQEWQRAGCE